MERIPSPEATRRATVPAHFIRLSDRRLWGFATPSVRLIPRFCRGVDDMGRTFEKVVRDTTHGYPPEVFYLWEDLLRELNQGATAKALEAFISLAVALLRCAHAVDVATAASLLSVEAEYLPAVMSAVIGIVLGQKSPDAGLPEDS